MLYIGTIALTILLIYVLSSLNENLVKKSNDKNTPLHNENLVKESNDKNTPLHNEKGEDKIGINAFALVGFILGLLSMITYWLLGIVPILAIIFSSIGLSQIEKEKQKGKKLAIAGLVLGILYTVAFTFKLLTLGVI